MSEKSDFKELQFSILPKIKETDNCLASLTTRALICKGSAVHTDVSAGFILQRSKEVRVGPLLSLNKKELGIEKC